MNEASPVIHIIDDDAALRQALSRLLTASGYRTVVYDSGTAFLERAPGIDAGCILLDVHMPGLTGLQLQEHLVKTNCILPIVFLSGAGDIAMSVKAIKAGAEDFLSKPITKEDLIEAIGRAMDRYAAAASEQGALAGLRQRFARLTAREHEVFALVIQGQLNKQIAYALGNTERTVKAQRQAVMEKMEADSVADLVKMGVQLGMTTGS
jgi:FixJ family two-component response regulator